MYSFIKSLNEFPFFHTVHYKIVMPKFSLLTVYLVFSVLIYLDKGVYHFNIDHLLVIGHNVKIIFTSHYNYICLQ